MNVPSAVYGALFILLGLASHSTLSKELLIQDITLTNLNQVTNSKFQMHQGRMLTIGNDDQEDLQDSGVSKALRFLTEENAADYARDLACGFCKQNLTKGQEGIIQSPGYPDAYLANVDCLWLLQTADLEDRIVLDCPTVDLEACGDEGGVPLDLRDYLVISPLWSFKRSWLYCGHATDNLKNVRHTSLCHKMAVSFRSNNNHNCHQGFFCTYKVI